MCKTPDESSSSGGVPAPLALQRRPHRVTAAMSAGWQASCEAALILMNSGRLAEARTSAERLVASVEGAAGMEAVELIDPLFALVQTTRRLGRWTIRTPSCSAP